MHCRRARLGAGVAGYSEMASTKVAEMESTVPAESYYRRNFYRWSAKATEMATAVGNSYAQARSTDPLIQPATLYVGVGGFCR